MLSSRGATIQIAFGLFAVRLDMRLTCRDVVN